MTVTHNLVATDLLVAVATAEVREGVSVRAFPEPELRTCLLAGRHGGNRFPAGVLPDGAFTLRSGEDEQSFCIEVIRAGAKGGNQSLQRKMTRYVELNRLGYFRGVYGLTRLRAVLLVTTSRSRVGRLRALAGDLPHGRNLFWSTDYERKGGFGMTFHPAQMFEHSFLNAEGSSESLRTSLRPHV